MINLAIETATTACAIGLQHHDVIDTVVLDNERRHTEVLTGGVAAMLAAHSLSVRDLDRVIVDQGPGLFTGLRVGLATAQGLARGLGIDLVLVSSLEILAHDAWRAGVRAHTVAMVDARRGEVFVQEFFLGDEVHTRSTPRVATPNDLAVIWATSGDPVTVTGDGAARYRDLLAVVPSVSEHEILVPSTAVALSLGAQRDAASEATPLYLREADAVANFTTRQRPAP